jgi:GDP-D-mannose dehydratase
MGYAKEYAYAAYAMLNSDTPNSYNIGSGKYIFLKEFIISCFNYIDLNWEKYTEYEFSSDPNYSSLANADKINKSLGWKSTYNVNDIAKLMMDYEFKDYVKSI